MSPDDTRFNSRAFVAAMAAFSGIGLPFSGLTNHIYGFAPLTAARHAWMAAHNVIGVLFAIFVTWHIVLNRKVLAKHLRKAAKAPRPSREAALAGGIVLLLLALAVGHAYLPVDEP
jgi:hypothetical protein